MCDHTVEHIRALRAYAIDRKFSFPPKFRRFSSLRLRKAYNGIGAEWMPRFFRQILTFFLPGLEAAALLHDFEFIYARKTVWNFCVANLRFVYNAARSRRFLSGLAAGTILMLTGYPAWKRGGGKDGTS